MCELKNQKASSDCFDEYLSTNSINFSFRLCIDCELNVDRLRVQFYLITELNPQLIGSVRSRRRGKDSTVSVSFRFWLDRDFIKKIGSHGFRTLDLFQKESFGELAGKVPDLSNGFQLVHY